MRLMCGSSKHTHTFIGECLIPVDFSSRILAVKAHSPMERKESTKSFQNISESISCLSLTKQNSSNWHYGIL